MRATLITTAPTELDKAYAAGFFDGEGSVGAGYQHQRLYLWVSLAQNERAPLDWCQARWGGSVYPLKSRAHHHWRVTHRLARRFLEDVLPYLIVKRERARLALESLVTLRRTPLRADQARRDAEQYREPRIQWPGPSAHRQYLLEAPRTTRELAELEACTLDTMRHRLQRDHLAYIAWDADGKRRWRLRHP